MYIKLECQNLRSLFERVFRDRLKHSTIFLRIFLSNVNNFNKKKKKKKESSFDRFEVFHSDINYTLYFETYIFQFDVILNRFSQMRLVVGVKSNQRLFLRFNNHELLM